MSYYSKFDRWRLGLDEDTSVTVSQCGDGGRLLKERE